MREFPRTKEDLEEIKTREFFNGMFVGAFVAVGVIVTLTIIIGVLMG